ncbi:unnamed protein product [Cochlearia groenlandica]
MGSDEQLSPVGESIPIPNRMLRRLKKATSISDLCPESKTLDSPFLEKTVPVFDSVLEDLGEKGDDEISDLDTREGIRVSETKESGDEQTILAKSVPDFDSVLDDLGDKGEDETCEMETGDEHSVSDTEEAGKKRPVLETSDGEGKENKRTKKRKKKKSDDFDELPVSTASMNMTKKERREHLDQLRAENQRLLRETRDAAFKPAPLVRKPISSVLEKIRRRKEEISKHVFFLNNILCVGRFLSRKKSKSIDTRNSKKEDENDIEDIVVEEKNEEMNLKYTNKQNHGEEDCLVDSAGPSVNSGSPSNRKAERIPTRQDPSLLSQTTNSGDELLEKVPSRSTEEVMTPSILAMKLKRNPSRAPEKTSEEEEYIKGNSEPETQDFSPGDPVRRFIDEDAEEEDDSDNDLLRFEDEDEEEDEDDDDLKDMIVSQFKEDPTDKDRRNELHQKWLEQQDAAGTEKLLQKLKRGLQHDVTSLSEGEDENDADDEERVGVANGEERALDAETDEDEEDPSRAISMRMNIKKIKETFPLMFTDEDDVYVSSDDEETEKKLLQQRMLKKLEQKTKSSSPIGDGNTEEILRHIKKPEIQKKAKPSCKTPPSFSFYTQPAARLLITILRKRFTAFKEKALMGISKNPAPSKSSFLGRLSKSSISEGSRKHGSNIVRGYIFERGDSNSKTLKTAAEEPSVPETIIQEKSRPRRTPAKFTASQSQERSTPLQATTVEKETSSRQRTSLYEILKMSSKKTCFTSKETVISSSHTESIFAAFKVDKKPN